MGRRGKRGGMLVKEEIARPLSEEVEDSDMRVLWGKGKEVSQAWGKLVPGVSAAHRGNVFKVGVEMAIAVRDYSIKW